LDADRLESIERHLASIDRNLQRLVEIMAAGEEESSGGSE